MIIYNRKHLRSLFKCVLFLSCASIGYVTLNVVRLATSLNEESLNIEKRNLVVAERKAIEDFVLGQLKIGSPDRNGKVRIVISLNARQVADVLKQNGIHEFEGAKSLNNAWDSLSKEHSVNEPSNISLDHNLPGHPNVSIVFHNPNLCGNASRPLRYIVCVNSHPHSRAYRDILRTTWASPRLFKGDATRIVFVIGRLPADDDDLQSSVRMEFELHGDIVQGDFVDVPRNATLKGILGLMWTSHYCKHASYVIRTNDDSFVNIFEMTRLMNDHVSDHWTIMCPLWQEDSMPILRDPKDCGQWCVAESDFPGVSHFPQYCASVVTIISRDLVAALYRASLTTPLFWISDVYLTGLLPKTLLPEKIKYVDLQSMMLLDPDVVLNMYADTSKNVTVLITQLDNVDQFRTAWKSLLRRLSASVLELVSDDTLSQMT